MEKQYDIFTFRQHVTPLSDAALTDTEVKELDAALSDEDFAECAPFFLGYSHIVFN